MDEINGKLVSLCKRWAKVIDDHQAAMRELEESLRIMKDDFKELKDFHKRQTDRIEALNRMGGNQ